MFEGEFVYCIIPRQNAPASFPVKGFEQNPVYTIPFKDLCIVVSKAEVKDYKPTDENIEIHRDVSLHVMKNHSVLPVAFGQVFKNRAILLHNLGKTYLVLKRSMLAMRNKAELGVKAIIPNGVEADKVFNEKSLDEARTEIATTFLNKLEKLSVKEKGNRLFSERLLINQAYLVEKNKINEFSETVGELTKQFSFLKIQYSGPWPAYNFVSIRIGGRG